MSIQHRRGNYADFDKSKMVAGEFAVVLQDDPETSDGKAVYIAFNSGSAKRLMTKEDLQEGIEAATQEVVDAITEATAQDVEDAQTAATAAAQSASEAASVIPELNQENSVAGTALQLMSSKYTSDSTPYLYRQTGGGVAVGTRELDEIVGGSVGWNQLAPDLTITDSTANGITLNISNYKMTLNGTATWRYTSSIFQVSTATSLKQNHVYFISGCPSGGSASTYYVGIAGVVVDTGNGGLWKYTDTWTTSYFRADVMNGVTLNNASGYIRFIDITQMLGSTIADYIYSLEQATAGSGIAKLKEWGFFAEDYYAYDAGSLQSVTGVSAHETVGFNLWDEEWEVGGYSADTGAPVAYTDRIRSKNFIPVFPNTQYYFCCNEIASSNNVQQRYYDANGNFLGTGSTIYYNNVFTTPSNARYLKFSTNTVYGTTYNHNICINISDSAKNGIYEPYTKHTYPLDSSLTLRGIPKLDSNNKLYFDGDVYQADGTVTRRYGIVDISDSSSYSSITVGTSGAGVKYCDISLLSAKQSVINKACVMSSYYDFIQTNGTVVNGVYKNYGNSITIYDNAFTDKNTAVSILQGKGFKVVYELATPTTEQSDPYTSVQICAEGGTEEYVTTGIVPVGHNTKYPANLRERLDSIPDLPTTAGTYRLSVTIVSGKPVYEWVTT